MEQELNSLASMITSLRTLESQEHHLVSLGIVKTLIEHGILSLC